MNFELDVFSTLIAAVLVLLVGKFLVQRISFLREYNIPEPVAGGIVAAIIGLIMFTAFNITASFHDGIKSALMLMFFSSIGLSASFSKLKQGGTPLLIFLACISVYVIVQNAVGMSLATILGLDPLIGLIAGSITLTGGHGTAGAWGTILEQDYGIDGAIVLGMASATFGLVIGGVIGGPVAKFLIKRHSLANRISEDEQALSASLPKTNVNVDVAPFENPKMPRLITASNAVTTLGMFVLAIYSANWLTELAKGYWFEMPTFVWALASGVIIRNVIEHIFKADIFDRAIDVFGNASLSLFLAIALLSLQLWLLADLAGSLIIILLAQTIILALYTAFVTFRVMGKDYDAAVLAAGHCGFGMGATPTAVANIQAITNSYGPSHKAFLIVPLCGAFFIDIVNAFVIQFALKLFG